MSDTLVEDAAHSPYGPSQAEGYTTCLDYVNANRDLQDDTSQPAAEGTMAHAISDHCLSLGFDAYDFIGSKMKVAQWEFEWDEDDADLLQPGIDRIREYGGSFFGEQRVDISQWTIPGQFGTLDRAIITPDLIIINDLKWGRMVPVSPVENKQLVLYALGLWNMIRQTGDALPDAEWLLSIDQPRCSGGGGEWRTNLAELFDIGLWIKERVELAQQSNPPRTASHHGCMWCKRKNAPGGCSTYDRFTVEMFGMQFEDLDDPGTEPQLAAISEFTVDRRAYVVQHRGMLTKWLDDLAEKHLADALAGLPAGNLKAVDGRKSPDKWHDKDAATPIVVSLLGDKAWSPRKIKTPTQLTKEITEEQKVTIDPLIKRGVKKPVLVPLGDARPAKVTASEFETLE